MATWRWLLKRSQTRSSRQAIFHEEQRQTPRNKGIAGIAIIIFQKPDRPVQQTPRNGSPTAFERNASVASSTRLPLSDCLLPRGCSVRAERRELMVLVICVMKLLKTPMAKRMITEAWLVCGFARLERTKRTRRDQTFPGECSRFLLVGMMPHSITRKSKVLLEHVSEFLKQY